MLIMLALFVMGQTSWAQKAYVTDSLKITLRTGPSIENKIIVMLDSGQPVEVLESSGEWSRVLVVGAGGSTQEGWVLSRFLMPRSPWEMQAKAFMGENAELKEKLATTEKELRESTGRSQELAVKLRDTTTAFARLENEYKSLKQGAAGFLELKTEHESTVSQLENTKKELLRLTKENEELQSSQRIKWFATGASVLFVGLIFGLVMGRKQRKRRSTLYD